MTVHFVLLGGRDLWQNLLTERTYYGTMFISGTRTGDALFSARAHEGRCRLEWVAQSQPSRLPRGASEMELGHGDTVQIEGNSYLVYVEPDRLEWSAVRPTVRASEVTEVLARLGRLSRSELQGAASRFLNLPHASNWWRSEFASRTGFVQHRDGRIPLPRNCRAVLQDLGAELSFDVQVWSMFRESWEGRERTPLTRWVYSDDLKRLLECATSLSALTPAS